MVDDSESNFDSVHHADIYGNMDVNEIEKQLALQTKKLDKLKGKKPKAAGTMGPPAPVKKRDEKPKSQEPIFKDDVAGEIKGKGGKKKDSEDIRNNQLYEDAIKKLCSDMTDTLEADHKANQEGQPAFRRFKLLSQIDLQLRNENVHSEFIHQNGLLCFKSWLGTMPDGSLPNQRIVLTILQSLDNLSISEEEDRAQLKNIEEDLQLYRDETNNAAYEECRQLSGRILDKWYSKRHNITTTYQNFSGKQIAQRSFESLIESEKRRYRRDNASDDSEDDEPKIKKKQKREEDNGRIRMLQQQAVRMANTDIMKRVEPKQQDTFKKIVNNIKKGKKPKATPKNNFKLNKLDW